MQTRHRHLDHITARPEQLHVPYLHRRGTIADRSPAVELHINPSGRLIARRNPIKDDAFMVRITYDDRTVWIDPDLLAHRRCEDCLDLWTDGAARMHELVGNHDASLYAPTDLPTTGRTSETLLLRADELPESRLAEGADR
ncbi:hypothetical protein [Gordonia sp. (in: high G+C Gram-positive bacteria)]|uniref:hypothetical protein n=1 Tax=Gordonia sp. (in: high G+C Gram-positive bacteria) TaxID=84139 RepID=UPI003C719275